MLLAHFAASLTLRPLHKPPPPPPPPQLLLLPTNPSSRVYAHCPLYEPLPLPSFSIGRRRLLPPPVPQLSVAGTVNFHPHFSLQEFFFIRFAGCAGGQVAEESAMGTREVYEEKLRSGNLYHDPTINPGLGSARCPRCLSLVNQNSEEKWTITPVLHDATTVAGSGISAMLSAVHGFNTGIPFIQKNVKGPKWLHLAIGLPPLFLFSGASAAFGAYAVPEFVQLAVSSYYTSWSASHYVISQATRYIEGDRAQSSLSDKLR